MSVLRFDDIKQAILPILKLKLEGVRDESDQVIDSVVGQFHCMMGFSEEMKEQLVEDLRTSFNTTVSIPAILRSKNGFNPWLDDDVKNVVNWKQWNRYKFYLRTKKKWSESVIDSLDTTSDHILDLLADPRIQGEQFDRRGLVMGYVQSGKTANFTAVINKAFDVGYRVVIVLAGLHNNLRSQTQVRLDEEVIGYTMKTRLNSDYSVGVGLMEGYQFADVISLTNSDNDGDFTIKKATTMFKPPILLVVKKNKTVLTNLLNYLQNKSHYAVKRDGVEHKVVPDLPLLIIDDEADQATVNTSEIYDDEDRIDPEYDPSTINGLIRDIFHTFDQRAYVGYTATPFANILIDRDSQTESHGYDLFPRDFIYGLPKPNNYAGPSEYFSLNDDADNQQGSLVRIIVQDKLFIPENHKKSHAPGELPNDLIESIYAFLIATAIRRLRGQKKSHSSMLVHVTRFTDVQKAVYNKIKDYVSNIKDTIRYGGSGTDHDQAMFQLYNDDFAITSATRDDSGEMYNWVKVREEIANVLKKLKVKEINGKSSDILDYEEHKEGHYVLAVGGDKLSRGLTLDGLTVSYYLRTSRVYDTLMQMGRWFGYREGYFDLCRIYTTEELSNWFCHIAVATEELRGQMEEMSEYGLSPEDYVLEISAHPDLQVTSPDKMRAARNKGVSYSASLIQTTVFNNTKECFARNFNATEKLIEGLGGLSKVALLTKKSDYYYWDSVKPGYILDFLDQYTTPSDLTRVDTSSLKDYIIKCNEDDELINWTVVIVNSGDDSDRKIADVPLKSGVTRIGQEYQPSSHTLSVRILTSEDHEYLDYDESQKEKVALIKIEGKEEKVRKNKAKLQAKARSLRNVENALLLLYPISTLSRGVMKEAAKPEHLNLTDKEIPIGFAISFPKSNRSHKQRNVIVNKSIQGGE